MENKGKDNSNNRNARARAYGKGFDCVASNLSGTDTRHMPWCILCVICWLPNVNGKKFVIVSSIHFNPYVDNGYGLKRWILIAIKSTDGPWNCSKQHTPTRHEPNRIYRPKVRENVVFFASKPFYRFESKMCNVLIPLNSENTSAHSDILSRPTDHSTQYILHLYVHIGQTLTASQTIFFYLYPITCNSVFVLNVHVLKLIIYYARLNRLEFVRYFWLFIDPN